MKCKEIIPPVYTFENDECFENGIKIGTVISKEDNTLLVKCYDGNPYMAGHVIKFEIKTTD